WARRGGRGIARDGILLVKECSSGGLRLPFWRRRICGDPAHCRYRRRACESGAVALENERAEHHVSGKVFGHGRIFSRRGGISRTWNVAQGLDVCRRRRSV